MDRRKPGERKRRLDSALGTDARWSNRVLERPAEGKESLEVLE
jgi:hypothetical protein